VHGIDVTPTILGVMGIPSRQARDGIDLSPAWNGGALPERTFFAEADHNNQVDGVLVSDIKKMVRQGSTKLLLDTHTGAVELYDIERDAAELQDLASGAPERVAELRALLEGFLADEVEAEAVPPPSAEERARLEALGY
jgi:arylsulfatase A-like enzyme